MPRPRKPRRVCCIPAAKAFKPARISARTLNAVSLSLDEFEALRLADLAGLEQDAAAQCLQVSRQTFGNILKSARKKTADCLVNSKILLIEGGNISISEKCSCGLGCGIKNKIKGKDNETLRTDNRK